jgi:hypothetical protein
MPDIQALEAVHDNLAFCLRTRYTTTRYSAFRREHLGSEPPVEGHRIEALVHAGLASPGDRTAMPSMPGTVFVEPTDAGRAALAG